MAFSNKMITYCGTIGSENLGIALKKAVDEVLGLVRQMAPEKLPEFSRKHTCITQMNVAPLNIRAKHVFEIIRIERIASTERTYRVVQVPEEIRHDAQDSGSIHYATELSPSYSVDMESNLEVYPDLPSSDDSKRRVNIFHVVNSSGKVIDEDAETITDAALTLGGATTAASEAFPLVWKDYVVMAAARAILQEKLNAIRASLPDYAAADFDSSAFGVAVENARKLIVGTLSEGSNDALSAVYWLVDEDNEMVTANLQTAQQELSRAQLYIAEHQKDMTVDDKTLAKLMQEFQLLGQQLASVEKDMKKFLQAHVGNYVDDTQKATRV
jgi:hypothetical protein